MWLRPRIPPVVPIALVVLAVGSGCADDGAGPPATTTPVVAEPVCVALDALADAWAVQATGPELGDPEALTARAEEQAAAIEAAVDAALATDEVPADVAADLSAVAAAGATYVQDALAWANGDTPDVAPTLVPGTTEAQQRIDAWARERCGAGVWG